MQRYVYTNLQNIINLAHNKPDDFRSLLSKTKYLIDTPGTNASAINGLRNLHLINFNGNIDDYEITDLDAHAIFTIVKFGLHITMFLDSYLKTGQTDLTEEKDLDNNITMYNDIAYMKDLEVNHHDKYKKFLPKYHKELLNFYAQGYDFTYE